MASSIKTTIISNDISSNARRRTIIEWLREQSIYKRTINIFLIVFDINLCLLDDENYKSDNSFNKRSQRSKFPWVSRNIFKRTRFNAKIVTNLCSIHQKQRLSVTKALRSFFSLKASWKLFVKKNFRKASVDTKALSSLEATSFHTGLGVTKMCF